ncbi:hypothetical protein [Nocardioides sp.]|uniref:hypothetical protein n=1 Tax=Nocardioides sp. TaxID=35761 RepID=UPI0026170CDC|nr:hypothetical protein [Nocardioides sp.]
MAAVVGMASVQALRLLAPAPDTEVNLLGIDVGEHDDPWATSDKDSDADDEATLFGKVLAAAAIPFVAIFVAIRVAILYVVPTLVVLIAASTTTHALTVWTTAAAWLLSVLVSLANEYAILKPVARHYDVPWD